MGILILLKTKKITGWRHTHQSWVRVSPPSDYTSIIISAHAVYAFICDTAISNYSKKIV